MLTTPLDGTELHFGGYATNGRQYRSGALVISRKSGRALVSKEDNNPFGPEGQWADLGLAGASPKSVLHSWNPAKAQYPILKHDSQTLALSTPVDVCNDCWKDADYINAFKPEVHIYVIREPGV